MFFKPLNLNSREFVPAQARKHWAAAPEVPRVKPIVIMLNREMRTWPMREPRTSALQNEVLTWIGKRVTGPTGSTISFGRGEERIYSGNPSPFNCDKSTEDDNKIYSMGGHNNDYRLSECLRTIPGFSDPMPEQLLQ